MPSIYNCPIVCNYDRETGEIGSHDMEIVKGEDGRLSLVNITDPVGVVPESANYWFEDFEEEDGTIHKYLYIEVLLWKRQEAYQKIKEDGITDESMEISIKEGHMENGIYVIERFEFTAFCLLGTAKPCYESASLMVFSQEDFKAKLGEMMREFKETVKTAQSPDGVGIHPQSYSEGGEKALDEKKELMTQYNLTEEMLGFSLDEFSLEELQAKFEEMKAKSKVDEDDTGEDPAQDNGDAGDDNAQAEVQSEPQAEPEGGEGAENFALAQQFLNELIDALHTERYDDPYWSDTTRYCYRAYNDDGYGPFMSTGKSATTLSERPDDWAWWTRVRSDGDIDISADEWNAFCERINEFRDYCGKRQYSFTEVYRDDYISAAVVNQAVWAIQGMSPPRSPPSQVTSRQSDVTAAFFNGLMYALNSIE